MYTVHYCLNGRWKSRSFRSECAADLFMQRIARRADWAWVE